jgi:catechol 2,3-dioxygenase-like lactoylglutathione lyase family enzyme
VAFGYKREGGTGEKNMKRIIGIILAVALAALVAGQGAVAKEAGMGRVVGIGGVFFKSKDPKALARWYTDVLGLEIAEWGGAILPVRERGTAPKGAVQVWSPFKQDTDYFAPSTREFMIDFEVDDLDAMCARLKAKGVTILKRVDNDPNGRFAWIVDPDGTKIELWQPKDK